MWQIAGSDPVFMIAPPLKSFNSIRLIMRFTLFPGLILLCIMAEFFSGEAFERDAVRQVNWEAEKLRRDAEQEQARKEREAQDQAKRVKALERWRNHEKGISSYHLPKDGKTYFRLIITGGSFVVESSKGIMIPAMEALQAIRFIESKRESGWRKNGERFPIAGFELDSIGEDGIVAGCHRFTWQELDMVKAEIVKAGFSLA